MFFEYDPEKGAANKTKHGMGFEEAQEIWSDPWLLEAPANTDDEPRFLVIGKVRDNRHRALRSQLGRLGFASGDGVRRMPARQQVLDCRLRLRTGRTVHEYFQCLPLFRAAPCIDYSV